MPKTLDATCLAGVVKVGALPVPGAQILSAGVGASSGTLIMEGDAATYIPDTTPDLESTLDKIVSVLTQIVTALTAIDVKPFGAPGSSVPVAAAAIAQITAIQAEVTILKETLK